VVVVAVAAVVATVSPWGVVAAALEEERATAARVLG
jgi:hypothetical protein